MAEGQENLLVVVLDCNPNAWAKSGSSEGGHSFNRALFDCVNSILVFLNAYLMLSHENAVALVASHTSKSVLLHPSGGDVVPDESAGQQERFQAICHDVASRLQSLFATESVHEGGIHTALSASLSCALCYIARAQRNLTIGKTLQGRILVVYASPDSPGQYMSLMNGIFAAAKLNVAIDACCLGRDSGLLQQAAELTGGLYLKLPCGDGVLEYLMALYLADKDARAAVRLPQQNEIDYRAACFCHNRIISMGFICSVCLSGVYNVSLLNISHVRRLSDVSFPQCWGVYELHFAPMELSVQLLATNSSRQ